MTAYRLDDTARLCAHLMARAALYAAVQDGEEAHWLAVQEPIALRNPPLRPIFSPKQFFFAEREPLFRFDGRRFVSCVPEAPPQVLFGVTACDLVAIAYQDRFFADDAHYQRRRAATLLVGVDCGMPCSPHAFCHAMDTGPSVRASTADLIVFLEAGSESSILIAETRRGQSAIEGLQLSAPPATWQARRRAAAAQTRERLGDAAHVAAGVARLNRGEVSAGTWEELGLRCVACSGCTTVCPTCSCFTTRDERDPASADVERTRLWDSCLLEGFQREASGHHPAASRGQRVERFYYHKLSDDFRSDFGRHGCVGCGRCDTVCPGVIGAQSVLRRIAQS
ncbi:MAG: 4Fe-4S dicluster domain-containing protein [Polyangiales bacterium]